MDEQVMIQVRVVQSRLRWHQSKIALICINNMQSLLRLTSLPYKHCELVPRLINGSCQGRHKHKIPYPPNMLGFALQAGAKSPTAGSGETFNDGQASTGYYISPSIDDIPCNYVPT